MSGWANSTRRSRLPNDWPARVAATRERARGRCEGISLDGEPRWHDPGCTGAGTDCDHDQRRRPQPDQPPMAQHRLPSPQDRGRETEADPTTRSTPERPRGRPPKRVRQKTVGIGPRCVCKTKSESGRRVSCLSPVGSRSPQDKPLRDTSQRSTGPRFLTSPSLSHASCRRLGPMGALGRHRRSGGGM